MVLSTLAALILIATPVAPASPEAAASAFLDHFKAMDERRFDGFFAADATILFPDGPFPKGRVEGREAILSAFHSFFARVRQLGRPSLDITPLDLRVAQYGDTAVLTFWLDGGEDVGRRSLVLRKTGSDWRIAHFHASTAEK